MRRRSGRLRALGIISVILVLILGEACLGRSPDVRYFMLGTESSVGENTRVSEMAVLVGPVRLPAYLERPQVAALEASGEVSLDEFNRWLGGFEDNFLRALSLGLARELGSARVVAAPSRAPFAVDYQIRLHIDDLILQGDEGLRMRVRWALIPTREESLPGFFVMDEIISVTGSSIEEIVQAHEDALAELVRRVAVELVARESKE